MLTDDLRESPLFATLSDDQLERVIGLMEEKHVAAGAVLAREGDFAYHLFVVAEGSAAVTVDDQPVTTLGHGDTFGEIGVMERGRRTATVVATTPLRLLTMWSAAGGRQRSSRPPRCGCSRCRSGTSTG
jgi:CRP-like cAMP-binding protein